MCRVLIVLIYIGFLSNVSAQSSENKIEFEKLKPSTRKGKLFLYYGWNRSTYSKSDIHFRGTGYNFTLNKVVAHDRPTAFDPLVYFNPSKITIPQYQYRIGYYISDKYSISWGFNHMKYVMDANQTVEINGVIATSEAANYNGTYDHENIELTKDFLQFEHTNGLNYLDFNFDRTETIWSGKKDKARLSVIGGIGAGIMYPKSDVRLFGQRKDHWHLAGYGFSTHIALRFEFLKNMFIQAQAEVGFINMPDIITTEDPHARAKQHFYYAEETIMIGSYLNFLNQNRKKK